MIGKKKSIKRTTRTKKSISKVKLPRPKVVVGKVQLVHRPNNSRVHGIHFKKKFYTTKSGYKKSAWKNFDSAIRLPKKKQVYYHYKGWESK